MTHPDLLDLVPEYLKRRNQDAIQIKNLISHHDFIAIQILSHKMHGSGKMYGFEAISTIGRELEAAAIENNLNLIESLNKALLNYLQSLDSSGAHEKN